MIFFLIFKGLVFGYVVDMEIVGFFILGVNCIGICNSLIILKRVMSSIFMVILIGCWINDLMRFMRCF